MSRHEESFDELGRLAALLCDGRLHAEGAARLEQLAGASPGARRFLLDYLHLEGELYWENAVGAAREPVDLRPRISRPRRAVRASTWMVAAAVAACLVLGGLVFWRMTPPEREAVSPPPSEPRRQGPVAALRTLVATDPRLRHHYPFEGVSPREKRRDREGGLDLTEVVLYGGRGSGEVDYVAKGWDAIGTAVRSHRASLQGNAHGVALQSEVAFVPPSAMTVELLLRFDGFPTREPNTVAGAVATRASREDCGFFFVAVEGGILTHLMDGEAEWVESDLELIPGDWYYVAGTFEVDGGATMINTYAANLTKGEKRLRHVVQNRRASGAPATGRLGIGKAFDQNTAHAYPWPGALDEIALYEGVVGLADLQRHLDVLGSAKK